MQLERLTPQEESVINGFWDSQGKTIREAIQAMPEPVPAYTTIASVVRNLENKGYLKGTLQGKQYHYEILISREAYSSGTIGRIVGQYYTGNYREVVQHFVESSKLSKEELLDIIKLIEQGSES